MKQIGSIFLLIFLIIPSYIWSVSWRTFRGTPDRTGVQYEQTVPPLTKRWEFNLGANSISSPLVKEGIIYLGDRNGFLHAIDAYTGTELWNFSTDGWIDATPTIYKDRIYVLSRDGKLYALKLTYTEDEQLTPYWTQNIGGTIYSSPIIVSSIVYCASGYPDRKLVTVDVNTGNIIWQTLLGQFSKSSPAISENRLCLGANDGKLYCINQHTGQIEWVWQTVSGINLTTPLLDGTSVYFAPGDDEFKVYALDLNKGTTIWQTVDLGTKFNQSGQLKANYVSSPAMAYDANGDKLIVICTGSAPLTVYGIYANNGTVKWQRSIGTASQLGIVSSPVIANDTIYIGSGEDKKLYALDVTSGTVVASYDVGDEIVSSPAISNGWVYVVTYTGKVIAYEVDTNTGGKLVTITRPDYETIVKGYVAIRGSAVVPNLSSYTVDYGYGTAPTNWTEVYTTTSTVKTDILAVWNTQPTPDGVHTVRLKVSTAPGVSGFGSFALNQYIVNNPPIPPIAVNVSDYPNDQGGKIVLSWTLSPDDGAGNNDVTEYRVYRSTVNLSTFYSLLATISKSTTFYVDTLAPKKTTYYYYLRAYDSVQESSDSVTVSGMSIDNVPPTAPRNLTLIAGNNMLDLSWSANTEPDMYQYKIYRDSGPGKVYLTNVLIPGTTHHDEPLFNGVTNFYWLTAVDDSYLESVPSYPPVSAYPYAQADSIAPGKVTDLLTSPGIGEGEINLSWTSPGDDGNTGVLVPSSEFRVQYSTSDFGPWTLDLGQISISTSGVNPGTGCMYKLINLAPYLTYYFHLWTIDDVNRASELSNRTTSYVTGIPPAKVTDLSAVASSTEGSINLEWSAPGDDGGTGNIINGKYEIRYSTDSLIIWNFTTYPGILVSTNTIVQSKQYLTVRSLSERTTYFFWVRVADEYNIWNDVSNTSFAIPSGIPPAAVVNLTALPGSSIGTVLLSWMSPGDDGNTGQLVPGSEFRVQHSTSAIGLWTSDYAQIIISTMNVIPGTVSSYQLSNLSPGVTYYFRLWTADEVPNWSEPSNLATTWAQIDLIPPPAPTGLLAFDTPEDYGDSINLGWTKSADDGTGVNDVQGYLIYRTSSTELPFSLIKGVNLGTTTYQDKPVITGIPYFYALRARDVWGNVSTFSNISSATAYASWFKIDGTVDVTLRHEQGLEIYLERGTLSQPDEVYVKRILQPDTVYKDTNRPNNVRGLDEAWEIKLAKPDTSLRKMAELRIPYNKTIIQQRNMREENLRIFWLDPDRNEWKMVNTSDPRPAEGRVVATGVPHFSVYRIMEFVPEGDVIRKSEVYTFPNPAVKTDTVNFKFKLWDIADVNIQIYTVSGEFVTELKLPKSETLAGKVFAIPWDIRNVASGVYLYRIEAKSPVHTKSVSKKLAIVH